IFLFFRLTNINKVSFFFLLHFATLHFVRKRMKIGNNVVKLIIYVLAFFSERIDFDEIIHINT
ncbi:MAG: hypothetical protein K0B10_15435, partial [Vicingaceae bacterium]|nr:hypothetical protein [Vicingaceae bacterium]